MLASKDPSNRNVLAGCQEEKKRLGSTTENLLVKSQENPLSKWTLPDKILLWKVHFRKAPILNEKRTRLPTKIFMNFGPFNNPKRIYCKKYLHFTSEVSNLW